MKKILSILLALLALLSGCSTQNEDTIPSSPDVPTTQVSTVPPTEQITTLPTQIVVPDRQLISVSLPAETQHIYAEDKTLIFSYTRQHMSLVHPDQRAADKIIIDFLGRIDSYDSAASDLKASASAAYNPGPNWVPFQQSIFFSPTRIDQSVLSLFGHSEVYSGGNHPIQICKSVSYDMMTGDPLTLASILNGSEKAAEVADLAVQAFKKLESQYQFFTGFESLVQSTVSADPTHNESWYFTNTGLCFYFAPSEIAPYSNGVITAEIPYSALAGLLYDGYYPAEQDNLPGQLLADRITGSLGSDLDLPYEQISEVILDDEGEQIILHTDAALQNIFIHIGSWDESGTVFTTDHTVFAAEYLSYNSAIMLQTYIPDVLPDIVISYLSNGIVQNMYLSQSGKDGAIILLRENDLRA